MKVIRQDMFSTEIAPNVPFARERILLFHIVIKFPVQDIHTHGIAINLVSLLACYFRNNVELLKFGKSTVDGSWTKSSFNYNMLAVGNQFSGKAVKDSYGCFSRSSCPLDRLAVI